jgi:gas vesicle structural protein
MSPESRRLSPIDSIDTIQVFASDGQTDTTLLDLLDNLLNNGVVLQGELILGVANVDLIYAQLSVLLSAVDRVLAPHPARKASERSRRRSRQPR